MAITVSKKEGILIFRLRGKIIASVINEIAKTVEEVLVEHISFPRLLFDFKEVTRIDGAGLGALMKIYFDIHPHGGKIALINVNKHIKNLIGRARLITVLKHFKSEDDAITALQRHH